MRRLLTFVGIILLAACGVANGPQIVFGTISVDGRTPDSGEIHFVPIDGTPGSVNATAIVSGEYRLKGRGGLPPGKYCVEIIAKQKTGRQVQQYNGFEMAMVDEKILISPDVYAAANSPLIHQVSPVGDATADFNLPAK